MSVSSVAPGSNFAPIGGRFEPASIEASSQCAPGRIATTEPIGSTLPIQNSTVVEISTRIRSFAAQGLKVRDSSSMLHIHPQVVLMLLDSPDEVTR